MPALVLIQRSGPLSSVVDLGCTTTVLVWRTSSISVVGPPEATRGMSFAAPMPEPLRSRGVLAAGARLRVGTDYRVEGRSRLRSQERPESDSSVSASSVRWRVAYPSAGWVDVYGVLPYMLSHGYGEKVPA